MRVKELRNKPIMRYKPHTVRVVGPGIKRATCLSLLLSSWASRCSGCFMLGVRVRVFIFLGDFVGCFFFSRLRKPEVVFLAFTLESLLVMFRAWSMVVF